MKLNISVKFFLMFFLSAALIIGGVSLFFSHYISRILVEREFASFKSLTSSFLAQTENEIQEMDDISINIFYSGLIQDSFIRFQKDPSDDLDSFSELLELFVALNGANFSLPLIAIYSNEGDKIGMGAYVTKEKTDLSRLPWVEKTLAENYHKYISLPYQSNMMKNTLRVSPYYISLFRTFRDGRGKDLGFIETAQYGDEIFRGIINHRKQIDGELNVFVFNERGETVYPFGSEADREKAAYYYSLARRGGEARVYRNPESGHKELLYGQKSPYTDWVYVCAQDLDRVLLPVRDVTRLLVLITLMALIVITAISWYMSNSVTRPIRGLLEKIHTTSIENLTGEINHLNSSYNEFDELNDAFHSMSDKLKRSMDELILSRQRESESRYLALQSQINPHFYYNSLSSIIALTEAHKEEDVITFCTSLSRIMRYVAEPRPRIVSLSSEIEYAEKYLYCMKVRYQSSLTYEIEIDASLADMEIPKLIIQPLIENALKHGTDCAPPWHITIRGERKPGGWIISVCDSGNGFPEDILGRINREEGLPCEGADQSGGEGGLGLANVCSRWRIFAGDAYYFRAENRTRGCCVSLGQIKEVGKDD